LKTGGRRHSTGFGYIGFGNVQSVFNRHSKQAFSEVKEKLDYEAHLHYKVNFLHKKLSAEEKLAIKNKIRAADKKRTKKALIITFIIAIPITYFVIDLIKSIMSH
jgi:hypothetical protein